MDNKLTLLARGSIFALSALALASCKDPTGFPGGGIVEIEGEETCGASPEWVGDNGRPTPPIQQFKPLPHPDSECPFYRGAWQGFLLAGEPDANGEPAVKSFPTIDDLFDATTPLLPGQKTAVGQPHGTATRSWLGDIKQAGARKILIDQNGHTIYYGIHVNQKFSDFVNANDMRSADGVHNAQEDLFFPGGIVEYKSAWQWTDVDPTNADGWQDPELVNYIATRAWVPTISQDAATKEIIEDRNHPKLIWVRLLAIHSVFTLPGHPEFIWGSMEHTDHVEGMDDDVNAAQAGSQRNVAPLDPRDINPTIEDPLNDNIDVTIEDDHLLFAKGTKLKDGNHPILEENLTFSNDATQKFDKVTNVYRMFPGSKSNTTHPDDAITSLNFNVQTLFAEAEAEGRLNPRDKRGHYRLVGAQWLDKPKYFTLDSSLQNDPTSPLLQDPNSQIYKAATYGDFQDGERQEIIDAVRKSDPNNVSAAGTDDILANGSDSSFALTAGEDRLSSTAMESFTQQPGSFQNCFSCHNTQAINSNGVTCEKDPDAPIRLQKPKLTNVSHILSQFLLEECTATGPKPAFCAENCKSPM